MSKQKNKEDVEKQGDKPEEKKETTWQFIRSMVVLVGIVVIIKWFVCDIFFIPSGSMEQTLHGHPDNGDRIFCTKINYLWRDPERWEVFVFKFPYEQIVGGESSMYKGEHFIKRCVGLPGESLALVGGDVFVRNEGESAAIRQVKSDKKQQGIWLPVYEEEFTEITPAELSYYWKTPPESAGKDFQVRDGKLEIDTAAPVTFTFQPQTRFGTLPGVPDRYTRRQVIEYKCPVIGCDGELRETITSPDITAHCPQCGEYLTEADVISYGYRTGYPSNYAAAFHEKDIDLGDGEFRGDWWHFVPDLAFSGKFIFENDATELTTVISSEQTEYIAIFSPEEEIAVFKNEKLLGRFASPLKAGSENSIQFYHLDGQLRCYIDDDEIFDITADSTELSSSIDTPEMTGVSFTVEGRLGIDTLAIRRDIYYYSYRDSRGFFTLPDDGYMALGDNCPASNDSRFWGAVPQSHLVGTAQFIWWPLHAIKSIR